MNWRLFLFISVGIFLAFIAFVEPTQERKNEIITTHQWDEGRKRWIHIEWKRTSAPTKRVDEVYDRYQVAWKRIYFEYEDPKNPNRFRYENDDMQWGLVESFNDWYSKYSPLYTDGRPKQVWAIVPEKVQRE